MLGEVAPASDTGDSAVIPARREGYRKHRATRVELFRREWWLVAVLFGSMGAVTWAIRGTSGWGGVDGTVVPGMTWALLWAYVCWRKGIDAGGVVFWLGLGISIGSEWGYGQYVSWIQGNFQSPGGTIPIAPWVGHGWFVITGVAWAAPGGAILGWALSCKGTPVGWVLRVVIPLVTGAACRCEGLEGSSSPVGFLPERSAQVYSGFGLVSWNSLSV